ncbi:MAG: oligosaccharide flippase family protein, partial [Planctomycetes bacterium]|nr:oligosaccharide flippase family protein [Planctomycetota bacterium]
MLRQPVSLTLEEPAIDRPAALVDALGSTSTTRRRAGVHRLPASSPYRTESSTAELVPSESLGSRCVSGAVWTVCCAAAGRVLVLGGNILLAYLLVPGDVGLAALALSIISISSFFSSNGLRNILIQRPEAFERNASEVFWLSLVLHTLAAGSLVLLAPLAGWFASEPGVVPLVMIHAISCPLGALSTVYTALLLRNLKYDAVARIRLLDVLVNTAGTLGLAAYGFGAYSLIVPVLLRVVLQAILTRVVAGRIAIRKPQFRRWPKLLQPAFWLMLNVMFASVYYYGTGFVIGLMCNMALIGIFFWGFQVAFQVLNFLSTNLKEVLFPTLLRLNGETQRQYRAYRRATRTLLLVVAPACFLQALLAAPLVELVFPARWLPAIEVIEWLSIGMLSQPLSVLAIALLMAHGRFRMIALATGLATALVLIGAMAGATTGSAVWIAAFTGGCFFVGNLVVGWVGFRQFNHGWLELFRTTALPLVLSAASAAVAWIVG